MTSSFEFLLSGTTRVGVDLWDPNTGSHVHHHAQPAQRYSEAGCAWHHTSTHHCLYACDSKKHYVHTLALASQSLSHGSHSLSHSLPTQPAIIAFSPNHSMMVMIGSHSTAVTLYNSDGRIVARFSAHFAPIACAKFSVDGRFLVTGGEDGQVMVWSVTDILSLSSTNDSQMIVKPYHTFTAHSLPVTSLVVDSGHIYSGSLDHTVCQHSLHTGHTVRQFVFPCAIRSVIATNTGEAVIVGGDSGEIYYQPLTVSEAQRVMQSQTQSYAVMIGHTHAVTSLSLSYDNGSLASASGDGSIRVWDTYTRQCLRVFKKTGRSQFDYVAFVRNDSHTSSSAWPTITAQQSVTQSVSVKPTSVPLEPFDVTDGLADDMLLLQSMTADNHAAHIASLSVQVAALESALAASESLTRRLYSLASVQSL